MLTDLVEWLNAVIKGKKESDMRLKNLEAKLIPHGVDLLKNLDNRIEELEANDSTQGLSRNQHVEERLIILEENSKLEHLNEKIIQRLVNLETNYQNSAGPEIFQNLFERLDVIENSPAQINSDMLTNVTKRLTKLENKLAESFV